MAKRREIRNSTAEFLIFQAEAKEQGVEVYYKDENIWATQKAMATLFDVNVLLHYFSFKSGSIGSFRGTSCISSH